MLKVRIIPCLDVKDGRVVKGVKFVDLRDAGDPVEQARLYDTEGADELCFLDITASSDNRDTLFDVVARTAEQCFIVVALDAKQIKPGTFEIFTHGGRNATGHDAVAWAMRMAKYGAGEILLTSMDRDGTKAGYDIPLTRAVANAVPVPVIASGGVGNLDHMVAGVREGHATAVLAASIFHFGQYTIRQAKVHLSQAGLPVRPTKERGN